MFDNNFSLPLILIKWLARLTSIVSITLMAMMFVGEGFRPSEISRNEWIGLFFFPFGVVLGMVIAWWKEGMGSIVTVGSLTGFYLVYGYLLGRPVGPWFVVFASPGFLFLLHSLLSGVQERHALI
jgi:hypothetical protein